MAGPRIAALLSAAHARFLPLASGSLPANHPSLASADSGWFALAAAARGGSVHSAGDADRRFPIMSVSKPFTFALACSAVGTRRASQFVGAGATGLPFDSVAALERDGGRTNPMVNPGALAAASLIPGATPDARWDFLREGISRFAGRDLQLDAETYSYASAHGDRNRGLALLLSSMGRLEGDPLEAADLYTRACCLSADAGELARMAGTLALGGSNPSTGDRASDADACTAAMAAMATAGLYTASGRWLADVGVPGKSGVSGAVIAAAPGWGGIGLYSPPLDGEGNSVRGWAAAGFLAGELGLGMFGPRQSRGA
ncbi:glutaminase [Hyaloraphidium curvatum]|nr:glutaminase [Hyaloraphidium curvatum]